MKRLHSHLLKSLPIGIFSAVLIVTFQNCSQHTGFDVLNSTTSSLANGSTGNPPASPMPVATPGALTATMPSFRGDWESGQVTGNGNINWMRIQAVSSDRISLIKDSSRPGTYARVEVQGGDGSGPVQRSEVLMMQDARNNEVLENENSGTQQYSFSVKFDDTWQTISMFGIFLQLHGDDSYGTNPAFAFSTAGDKIVLGTRTGDIVTSKGAVYNLSNGALNKGKWIDFILTIKFTKDNTGFVTIMRRDEGQTDFIKVLDVQNIPTLLYSSNVQNGKVLGHYWKHGLYRNTENFTSILYLDGFTRSTPAPTAAPATP